jgi:hypothetical protein
MWPFAQQEKLHNLLQFGPRLAVSAAGFAAGGKKNCTVGKDFPVGIIVSLQGVIGEVGGFARPGADIYQTV